MLPNHSRKVHRCLTLLMAVVFATATSTTISAQPRTATGSQSPTTEAPSASGTRQPVQAFGGQLTVFLVPEMGGDSGVFSPDGNQILTTTEKTINSTASKRETAYLWDSKGNLLGVFRHEDRVNSAVFSPDGNQILTASQDRTARLWDNKGNVLAVFRHEGVVKSAVFSPNGNQIVTASWDKTARLWDTKGNLLAVFRHEDVVKSAVFSPNGNQILTASWDKTARLWDNKGNLLAVFRHEDHVTSAIFSPDGNQILTAAGRDGIVRLWDSQGNLLAVFQHKDLVKSAVFSPDGNQILTAGGNTVRLWDSKGNLLAVFRLTLISSAVFSPSGRQILTISYPTRLWDVSAAIAAQAEQMAAVQAFQAGVSKKNAQLLEFGGHDKSVTSAVFNPDGRKILTAGGNTARLWDSKANLLAVFWGHEDALTSAVFSPDGNQILTASMDGTARLWDSTGNLLALFRLEHTVKSAEIPTPDGHGIIVAAGTVNAVFSRDGNQILTASFLDGTAQLWDSKGNLLAVFRHETWVRSAVFSPDGNQILTASIDGTARLWDSQGNLLTVFQHESWVNSAVFSPDGNQILTTSWDGTARLWDSKGNLLTVFRQEYTVKHALFSPDGNQILTTGGNTARLWDSKGNLLTVFRGQGDWNTRPMFSPDGRQILTASMMDGTVRLWDSKGHLLAEFRGHESWVTSAVFSPDGRQILTVGVDKTTRLWDVSTAISAQAEQMAAQQAFQAGVSEKNAQPATTAFQEGIQLERQGTVESRKLALQKLEEALELYRADRDYAKAAQALLSIGNIYANLGQFQTALDSYNQALLLSRQAGAKAKEAAILNRLGQLYNDLADPKTALDYYNQALPLWYQLNNPRAVAATLNNIGGIHLASEEWSTALGSYNQALIFSRYGVNLFAEDTAWGGDLAAEANPWGDGLAAEVAALTGIGSTYIASQEWSTALNAYNQALNISRYLNDKVKETTILNQLGKVYTASGQESTALDYYNQALLLSQQLGYKSEQANILYNQAILNRRQKNLTAAKTEIETAINIIEELRTQIASQELRQSYFARNQDYYQFYIDLLMQLHQQNPNKGYDAEALQISERARARSLLELLSEANADIRSGVDPKLLEQERTLTQQLNDLEYRKYQLLSTQNAQKELNDIQPKIDTLLTQLKQLEAKIRIASPRYANLKYPEPLTLQQIQQQVLDDDTVLLEYSLGEDRSYLWAVTKNNITSYQLPPRSEIETAAQSFFRLTTDKNATLDEILPASTQLTQLILPNLPQLSQKRLLIVPDGQLHYIPFSALSRNPSDYQPLLTKHQVIHLPSASTVAINRNQLGQRTTAPNTLAIIADPIFSPDDSRLTGKTNPPSNNNRGTANLAQLSLERSATTSDIEFKPLPYTRTEADTILQLLQGKSSLSFFEFDANLNTVKRPDLSKYQIIHFATHGILNPDYPELSGLVVSLVDRQGNPQNGFLRLNDIFNLNLPAELVVLSACQTGSGKNVKGEGIVGLTRGFMYAGAPRVVASLWNVNDASTAQLMSQFYQKYLQENLPPAEALRQAQLAMWQADNIDWRTPYFWAAFTLQGEWR